jgi:hypothetical protein
MPRYPKLTHAEHVRLGAKVRATQAEISEIYFAVQKAFGKSHPAARTISKIMRNWQTAKSDLDTEYHRVTTGEQFQTQGHVYYEDRPAKDAQNEEQRRNHSRRENHSAVRADEAR